MSVKNVIKEVFFHAMIFGILALLIWVASGCPSLDQTGLATAISKMGVLLTIAVIFFALVTVIIFGRLKYWYTWTILLAFLALLGLGLDLPPFQMLYPADLSAYRVALTLAAVVIFWGIEQLIFKHSGSAGAGNEAHLDEDEMISLDLNGKPDGNGGLQYRR